MTYGQLDLFPSEEFSPQGSLVRTSPLLAAEPDLPVNDLDCFGRSLGFSTSCTRDGSCSKTCQGSYRSTVDEIWAPCSGRWQNSGMGWRGGFLTRNSSESRSVAVESSLSDILETPGEHLRKYFLSAKAAQGILRRAGKRGRILPEPLKAALQQLAQQ